MIDESLFVTGWCPPEEECPDGYWCLSDGAPPGYWDPEDGCPPGCQEVPEYSNTIPGIEFCTIRPDMIGDLVHSDGKYAAFWQWWGGCSLFLEDGTERIYSATPPNDPDAGNGGYWGIHTAAVYNDRLYLFYSKGSYYGNLYLVEHDIINNVPLRQKWLIGDQTSIISPNTGMTGAAMEFPNVRGGIITIGGEYNIYSTLPTIRKNQGLLVVDTTDLSWNLYGTSTGSSNHPDGCVWEANTTNFLYAKADSLTDGKVDLYYSEGDGTTVTEIKFPNHPTTDMLGVFDLMNGTAAVPFTDRVIICTSNGTFIKEITEGYSLTRMFADYGIDRFITTYQDKFIVACNPTSYKGTASVGVADVYHIDTFEYLYTLNIPAGSVAPQTYYGIVVETDYATYRRRSNDNNNQNRDLLICVKTQEG